MDYKEEILRCFSDFSERELNYWGGNGALLQLYNQSSGEGRSAMVNAIGEIVTQSDDWKIVANLLFMITALDIAQLDPVVEQLRSSKRFPENSAIAGQLVNHTALRQLRSR